MFFFIILVQYQLIDFDYKFEYQLEFVHTVTFIVMSANVRDEKYSMHHSRVDWEVTLN